MLEQLHNTDTVFADPATTSQLFATASSNRLGRVTLDEWDVLISDAGSANGTFVRPAAHQPWHRLLPGERVAQLANQAGFRQVHMAENATDASMLSALRQII